MCTYEETDASGEDKRDQSRACQVGGSWSLLTPVGDRRDGMYRTGDFYSQIPGCP